MKLDTCNLILINWISASFIENIKATLPAWSNKFDDMIVVETLSTILYVYPRKPAGPLVELAIINIIIKNFNNVTHRRSNETETLKSKYKYCV